MHGQQRATTGRHRALVCALALVALARTADGRVGARTARPSTRAPAQLPRRAACAALAAGALGALGARPEPASASYTMYKAASEARDQKIREGTWKQGIDLDDAAYQGVGARSDYEKKRALQYAIDSRSGKAGKFCAGQMSVVSPQMENLCVRYGVSKADMATQDIDQFGSAVQRRIDR